MCVEPGRRRASDPPLLLLVHHLGGRSERRPCLLLHLAEDEPPAAPDYQVELVASRPRIRVEDSVAAQPVPPPGATFGVLAGVSGHAATLRSEIARDCEESAPA